VARRMDGRATVGGHPRRPDHTIRRQSFLACCLLGCRWRRQLDVVGFQARTMVGVGAATFPGAQGSAGCRRLKDRALAAASGPCSVNQQTASLSNQQLAASSTPAGASANTPGVRGRCRPTELPATGL